MNKIISYFIFLIKNIIFFRFEITKPKKKKYLLIDGSKDLLSKIANKNEYNILYRRGEKINLPILFECLIEFKLNSENYYLKYIKYSKPKIIFSFFDHINIFYKLSELTNIKTIMFQYGTKSWDIGIISEKNFNSKKNLKKFFVDYIFLHNRKLIKIYANFVRGKKIAIGSFPNNFCDIKIKKKREILYLSTFRPNTKSWHYGDAVIIKKLYTLAKKNNLKFNISGRHVKFEKEEIEYYDNIINDKFYFISKKRFADSYKVMNKFKFVFTTFATMAKENLAAGGRTGIILFKPKNNQSKVLKLGYGNFEGLNKKGPFWSNMKFFEKNEVERIFNFVTKSRDNEWKKIKTKFIDPVLNYDEKNKKVLNIIKKINDEKIKKF